MSKRGEGITAWTKEELEQFRIDYPEYGKKYCMEKFSKSDSMVRTKASELRLKRDPNGQFFKEWQKRAAASKVGKKRPGQSAVIKAIHDAGKFKASFTEERRAKMAEITRSRIARNGHPKGMKGKHHTTDVKMLLSRKSKDFWQNKSEEELDKLSRKQSKTVRERGLTERMNATWKSGWREIGGKRKFFRSRWEANYARYLQVLKVRGEILDWLHEPDVFWFEQIKRGTLSYLPDFKVFMPDGSIEYHEVKGWMDARSATQQKRMKKYYPCVCVKLIQAKEYKAIEIEYSSLVEGWEKKPKPVKKKSGAERI